MSSGSPTIGGTLALDAIAAVIIGGTSLFGGKGTIIGTFLGVLFVSTLANGLVLLGVNPYAQYVAKGAIVIIVVLLSQMRAGAK